MRCVYMQFCNFFDNFLFKGFIYLHSGFIPLCKEGKGRGIRSCKNKFAKTKRTCNRIKEIINNNKLYLYYILQRCITFLFLSLLFLTILPFFGLQKIEKQKMRRTIFLFHICAIRIRTIERQLKYLKLNL